MTCRAIPVLCLGLLLLGGGCTRDAGVEELAGELRALRLQLRAQPAVAAQAADPTAMATALAPLRDVLEGLTASQRDLQGKQLALTQELQRWSVLVVESTTGSHAEQGRALGARLQQLEAALQEQGERHRQVESLLQGALDKTADRLESFMQRLDTLKLPVAPVAPPNEAAPGATPAAVQRASTGEPPTTGTVAAPRKADLSPWLWSALALGALAVSVLCLRVARTPNPRSLPTTVSSPVAEPATQDLWEAAALLGEVVGRLRAAAAPGAPPVPAMEPAPQAEQVTTGEIEDLFVLDDDEADVDEPRPSAEPAPVGVAAGPVIAPGIPRTPAPAPVTCRLQPRDLLAATGELLRILAADPRVLRRPEPTLTPRGAMLEVSFALLPGLPPGERSQLEQRLRDAVA